MICAECSQIFKNEIDAVIQNHEPCATKHGTQPTALQQLKAKIAALESRLRMVGCISTADMEELCSIREEMRQLSAV